MQSDARLRRIEDATDLPLLILALVLVPLLIVPSFIELSDGQTTVLEGWDWMISAVFAMDFGLKLAVAPRRKHYARTHWLELGIVALPLLQVVPALEPLQPLRALRAVRSVRAARLLRVLRVGRAAMVIGRALAVARQMFVRRGLELTVVVVMAVGLAGALLGLLAERDAEGGNIHTFGDAVWWSIGTITTVGFGDKFPTTPMGRGVSVGLMLTGVTAMAILTAEIAAFLVKEGEDAARNSPTLGDLHEELRALRSELAALRGDSGEQSLP